MVIGLFGGLADALGRSSQEWQGRRVYQIVTDRFSPDVTPAPDCNDLTKYCGGTFKGIQNHLDYITDMGFNAIWISPVVVNWPTDYHGYAALDFFHINPHFGSAQDLKNLVDACHKANVWVMIDIVANHAATVGTDFARVQPFNKSEYYHDWCDVNNYQCFTNEILNCRLSALADLNQDHPFVREQLKLHVQWLLSEFQFDGIRADTIMFVKQNFWVELVSFIGTPYFVGEVWSNFQCNLQYTQYGIPATLNYPLYDAIRNVFLGSWSMRNLGNAWRQQQQYAHPTWEMNFIDNHDNPWFMSSTNKVQRYQSALAHMFFTDGVPCVYEGTEHLYSGTKENDQNRRPIWPTGFAKKEMYYFLQVLNTVYQSMKVTNYPVEERWQDDSVYCLIRGPVLLCTTNTDDQQTRTVYNLHLAGLKVCDAFNPSNCMKGAETMQITIPAGGKPLLLVGK